MFRSRPAAEQIDASTVEFSGARSREKEFYAFGFYEAMDFVEKDREPLDLVDHHGSVSRA
jgi:hypothetical protein